MKFIWTWMACWLLTICTAFVSVPLSLCLFMYKMKTAVNFTSNDWTGPWHAVAVGVWWPVRETTMEPREGNKWCMTPEFVNSLPFLHIEVISSGSSPSVDIWIVLALMSFYYHFTWNWKLEQKPLICIQHSCLLIFPSISVFLSLMSKQSQSLRDHQI